jgi:SAM-dependent methyltransferase
MIVTDDDRMAAIASRILLPEFPRSARYDPQWQFENAEGASLPLWSIEWLSEVMDFTPGMRVLDLGCGNAIASIFLAREFGVSVVAADLSASPTGNWERITAAGCAESVLPVTADARDLKFAHGYFDAIVGISSFQDFATDDLFPRYLLRFLRPGGQLGIVVPGVTAELDGQPPDDLRDCWSPMYYSFHTPQWWARQFARTGMAEVSTADLIPDGWRYWLIWEQLYADYGLAEERPWFAEFAAGMKRDAGRVLGLTRLVVTRPSEAARQPRGEETATA